MRRDFYTPSTQDDDPDGTPIDEDLQRGRQAVAQARQLLRGDTDAARRTRVGLAVLGGIGALAAAAPMVAAIQEQPQAPAPDAPVAQSPERGGAAEQSPVVPSPLNAQLDRGETLLRTVAGSVETAEKALNSANRNTTTSPGKALSAVTEAKDKATAAAALVAELVPAVEQLGDSALTQRAIGAREAAASLVQRANTAWEQHQKSVETAKKTQLVTSARTASATAASTLDTAAERVHNARAAVTAAVASVRERKPALHVEKLLDQARTALEGAAASLTSAGTSARKAADTAESAGAAQPRHAAKTLLDRVRSLEDSLAAARGELPKLLDKVADLRRAETLELATATARVAADAVTATSQSLDAAAGPLAEAEAQRGDQQSTAAVRDFATTTARLSQARQLHTTADHALRTATEALPAGSPDPSAPATLLRSAITTNTANNDRLANFEHRIQALAAHLTQQPPPAPTPAPPSLSPAPAAQAPARQAAGVSVQLPGGRGTVQAPNTKAANAIRAALSQLGTPYVWGGQQPGRGFDCSGLTSWAYRQAGVHLPRVSTAQAVGPRIQAGQLQPGDLVVWAGHVAMYIGNGYMVEAGSPVQISRLRTTNLKMRFLGFHRPTG
ncbi:NlpC/P60 family protein [Crossiella cryophila]|uniref:Cell wall-associated NlpC family hydrolase n=1 Tax=Crossiella cryophila TaxID=43355 RepID=A0A7W7FY01_9PSEU|nr:cell wall-associated NlpC family hydrolase [Crossiella cryophila]